MPQQVDNGAFYEYRRDHKFRGRSRLSANVGKADRLQFPKLPHALYLRRYLRQPQSD